MIYTTLNEIRSHVPCKTGWERLLDSLGKTMSDDEPISLLQILDSNGIEDALWCLRCWPELSAYWRLLAVICSRESLCNTNDAMVAAAIDVAERHVYGLSTNKELAAARAAADSAARSAADSAAMAAAYSAVWAAQSASWAADSVAMSASWAAQSAADSAACAAWAAAYSAEESAALAAANSAAARELQTLYLLLILEWIDFDGKGKQ